MSEDLEKEYAENVSYIADNCIGGLGLRDEDMNMHSMRNEFKSLAKKFSSNVDSKIDNCYSFYRNNSDIFKKLNPNDLIGFSFAMVDGFLLYAYFDSAGFKMVAGHNPDENKICVADMNGNVILKDTLDNMEIFEYEANRTLVKNAVTTFKTHMIWDTTMLMIG